MQNITIFYLFWSNAYQCFSSNFCYRHGGRILWRRCTNFLISYSYTSTWTLWGFVRQPSWAEAAWYEWVYWLPLWWPTNTCSVYLTNSAKRKRRKPPRSAPDLALGRLQSNSTSMVIALYWKTIYQLMSVTASISLPPFKWNRELILLNLATEPAIKIML